MTTSPRPQKRTTNTCVTCRARKVRCDGRREICSNCERLGFSCSYDENVGVEMVSGEGNGMSISVPRRRVRQACQNCHARKARCSGSMPSCDRCRAQGLECVYRPGKRSLPLPPPVAIPSSTSAAGVAAAAAPGTANSPAMSSHDDGQPGQAVPNDYGASASSTTSPGSAAVDNTDPDEALALKAFDNFFRHVHHIAMFSFLHRPSLMERYHAGSLDRALLLAIIGITSLLTDLGPGMDAYGSRCIEDAVTMCLADLERPSIPRLQALVLAIKHRILSKRFSSAFMLHAIASRFAIALRLNHENPDLCFLAREARRRLMWTIYMIDSSIAAGQPEFALWADAERQIHLQLPCNERNFDFDLPEPTEPLRFPGPGPGGVVPPLPDVLGLMALHIRLHWMRNRILECTSRAVASPSQDALALLPGQCSELATELEAFEARLPASFRGCEANFRLRSYSPRLGIFVMTHVWWRQCHLDLYRIFLPGLKEALPPAALQQLDLHYVMNRRRTCYEHAKAMADMFSQLLTLGNKTPVADLDLPACAFQCTKILYHGVQMAEGAELGLTQERVQELANVCLRAARQSTPGPASAAIQSDIERLISNGLQLPETPASLQLSRARGPSITPGSEMPYLVEQIPDTDQMQGISHTPPAVQMPTLPPTTLSPMTALNMPVADPQVAAAVPPAPPSQTSAMTGASNAFEETADGFIFGPEMFGVDSWPALSHGWTNMTQFPGTTI